MGEYKPNSHKYREEQNALAERQKVQKAVKGKVKVKKKKGINKLADNFISEDVKNVKSYVIMDVLIPSLKKAISDIVTNGIDMILYGETRGKKKSATNYVSYDRFADNRRDDRSRTTSRVRYSIDDIILETKRDVDDVIQGMEQIIDQYGVVRVADLYDLVGITGDYTDNKYGWDDIRTADAVRTRDGDYALRMPKAKPIK